MPVADLSFSYSEKLVYSTWTPWGLFRENLQRTAVRTETGSECQGEEQDPSVVQKKVVQKSPKEAVSEHESQAVCSSEPELNTASKEKSDSSSTRTWLIKAMVFSNSVWNLPSMQKFPPKQAENFSDFFAESEIDIVSTEKIWLLEKGCCCLPHQGGV